MNKKYKKGEKVYIINRKLSGDFIVEGQATIVKHICDETYEVRFGDDRETYERFIDPSAQDSPEEYAVLLTESINNNDQ